MLERHIAFVATDDAGAEDPASTRGRLRAGFAPEEAERRPASSPPARPVRFGSALVSAAFLIRPVSAANAKKR